MLAGLFQLLQGGVALVAGGDQILAGLRQPLLGEGVARRGRGFYLMARLEQAVVVVLEIAQDLGLLVGGGQQSEAAADLGGGQGRAHLLDFLARLGAIVVARFVVLEFGDVAVYCAICSL